MPSDRQARPAASTPPGVPEDVLEELREHLDNPPTKWQQFRRGQAVIVLDLGLPFGRRVIFGRTGVRGWRDGLRWRVTWTRDYDFRGKHSGLFCVASNSAAKACGFELELRGYTHDGWWTVWLYCPHCRYREKRPAEIAYTRAVREAMPHA